MEHAGNDEEASAKEMAKKTAAKRRETEGENIEAGSAVSGASSQVLSFSQESHRDWVKH